MICQFEYIALVSIERNSVYILRNTNPGKPGESEWRILSLDGTSGERQIDSSERKNLNGIIESYASNCKRRIQRVASDEPVLCLYMPQRVFSECVREIEDLL